MSPRRRPGGTRGRGWARRSEPCHGEPRPRRSESSSWPQAEGREGLLRGPCSGLAERLMGDGATAGDKRVTLEGLGVPTGRAAPAAGRKDGSVAGFGREGPRPAGCSWRGPDRGLAPGGVRVWQPRRAGTFWPPLRPELGAGPEPRRRGQARVTAAQAQGTTVLPAQPKCMATTSSRRAAGFSRAGTVPDEDSKWGGQGLRTEERGENEGPTASGYGNQVYSINVVQVYRSLFFILKLVLEVF